MDNVASQYIQDLNHGGSKTLLLVSLHYSYLFLEIPKQYKKADDTLIRMCMLDICMFIHVFTYIYMNDVRD